jgi:hypothetical protein
MRSTNGGRVVLDATRGGVYAHLTLLTKAPMLRKREKRMRCSTPPSGAVNTQKHVDFPTSAAVNGVVFFFFLSVSGAVGGSPSRHRMLLGKTETRETATCGGASTGEGETKGEKLYSTTLRENKKKNRKCA